LNKKILFITGLTGLLLVFITGTLFYTAQKEKQVEQVTKANLASLVRMHSPTLGKAGAPVVIVEFFDPACETCRRFYPLVKQMMAEHPDKIRLVLRYTPFHSGSDQIVAMLEAARKQNKFWPSLEALLTSQADWVQRHTANPSLAWKHLEGLDLDLDQLKADMAAPEILQVIAQDIEDAQALNVTKTPEFFVNGNPLPSFGYEQLKRLVDEALSSTQR